MGDAYYIFKISYRFACRWNSLRVGDLILTFYLLIALFKFHTKIRPRTYRLVQTIAYISYTKFVYDFIHARRIISKFYTLSSCPFLLLRPIRFPYSVRTPNQGVLIANIWRGEYLGRNSDLYHRYGSIRPINLYALPRLMALLNDPSRNQSIPRRLPQSLNPYRTLYFGFRFIIYVSL